MTTSIAEFDLQPDPRILPMLGEINLLPWRCLAEFIDNSVDSFLTAARARTPITVPQIHISVPTTDDHSAKITIRDNGPGMSSATLERAVRAGWTSNDPMHSLGMFGMGFNIATARLGSVTRVWTTRTGDSEWCGLEIDFAQLTQQQHYRTPRLSRPKLDAHEQGTEITVERLKPEQRRWFAISANRSKLSRDHFAVVYSAMLRPNGLPISFELYLNGNRVKGKNHCIWGAEGSQTRQVTTATYGIVSAYQPIDTTLPDREFCLQCWQWVPQGSAPCPACGSRENVVVRHRRVQGWLGVQRYGHQSDFGIDFIRNGRKIEVASKDLFVWDTGGTVEPEYPIDDPRHRGRLVGEIHLDHCRVPYTKDRFDRNDPAWDEMLRIVRGDGPLRPNRAAELGFGPNDSPLFVLYQAFRRNQPHGKVASAYAKLLAVKDNDQAEMMAKKFYAGEVEYQSDAKWWDLVEEADRALLIALPPTPGPGSSPLPGFTGQQTHQVPPPPVAPTVIAPATAPTRVPLQSLTREYQDSSSGQRWNVKAYRVDSDDPLLGGENFPWAMRATPGGDHEFYVNEGHDVFRSATLTPLDALLAHLAWAAMDFVRGGQSHITFASVLTNLREHFAGTNNLDLLSLSGEATLALTSVARSLPRAIGAGDGRVLFAELTPSEQEAVQTRMAARSVQNPQQAIDEGRFLEYAPWSVMIQFVESHAELFFDGKYWDAPFATLDYGHAAATEGARAELVRYYAALMSDAVWLVEQDPTDRAGPSRSRVLRAALALDLLVPSDDSTDAQ